MLTAILAIAVAAIALGSIGWLLADNWSSISFLLDWVTSGFTALSASVPDWLSPFIMFALVVFIICVILRIV